MNMKQLFLAASVACLACTAPGRAMADVKAGVDAWEQGKYDAAVKQWRPAAAAGDADAQFNLGQAYKLGRGVPMDIKAATEWFRKAAAHGHIRRSEERRAGKGCVRTCRARWLEDGTKRNNNRCTAHEGRKK